MENTDNDLLSSVRYGFSPHPLQRVPGGGLEPFAPPSFSPPTKNLMTATGELCIVGKFRFHVYPENDIHPMPNNLSPNEKHPPQQPSSPVRVWNHVQLCLLLLGVCFTLTGGLAGAFYIFISLDIPAIKSLAHYTPPVTSYIYDTDQQPVAAISHENRIVVPLSAMPPLLPKAFLAAEDSRFYQHSGVDAWSILRALIHNLRSGARGQGGSTITQQVARALLLTPEKSYTRKLKEAILAYRIDKALGKEEILNIYLNHIYLGSGAYGVEAAAQTYFGKRAQDLNVAEIALIAGLPPAPSSYSPFRNFKLAKNRQAYVLNRMAEEKYISAEEARKAQEQPLFWGPETGYPEENSYFVQMVRNYVEAKYGSDTLLKEGLHIYTTLDQGLQAAANMAVKRGTAKWAIRQSSAVRVANAVLPQAALIAMEVKSGRLRALIGGTDFDRSQFNRAYQARRQPGSSFKPFIYAAGLDNGMTPATTLVDEPLQLRGSSATDFWEPKNYDGTFEGPVSLRSALIRSRNIPTIKILQEVGSDKVIDLARRLGITTPMIKNLSLALGSCEVSPLELTRAYAAFANNGQLPELLFIEKIEDRNGKVLETHKPAATEVMDPRTAYQVTHLLQGVINEGTGTSVKSFDAPAAGKTGTTDQNMDAWFVGYTPELVTCVWVGHDQKIALGTAETGGRAAAPIWLDFMNQTKSTYPPGADFVMPPGLVMMPMNPRSGGLSQGGDHATLEPFKEENLHTLEKSEGEDASGGSEPGGGNEPLALPQPPAPAEKSGPLFSIQ